ncbi:ABR131Wp [Eremothecium gossypii ATCC 10895]|uniref:ABR131Wp n=1 Tax=Eremothecium gossypii (strain ATCC 10895 / CBS 109.51 / FGSC 9923 / NRRL Y-1056) TaxID=284811 RepID=Q75D93_EREGS|nr:ABR131Wp [Eremothecium gossypii ATCC 10895]AAS50902.1 ABR131Wp [Eremothecium gossypii ATCC 10895]AEY95191.1 FABR131Wp [Eremothecium gossypii FDAG1]
MSSENSFAGFVSRNRTAIIATAAAGASAVGAYYYYQQLQRQSSGEVSKDATGSTDVKSKKKKKRNNKKKYPVDQNGEPDLSGMATFTEEQKEKYAMALKDKGNECFKDQRYEEAIKFYDCALKLKEDPVFYSNRSACYVPLNKLEKVVEDTTAALKLKPDYSKCLLRRATANESLGNYADAMLDLSAVSLYGGYSSQTIEPVLERNMNKQAMQVLKQKLSGGEKHELPSNTSLASFFRIFPSETSLENYDETSEADRILLKGLCALHARQAGSYEIADEAFTDAVEKFTAAHEANPDNAALKQKLAIALEHVGILKFLKNEPLEAHNLLQKAIDLFPRPNSYIYMGLIMADKGQADEYAQNFEKALELDPKSSAAYYHRAQMNFVIQQFDQAGKDFDKAKECDPSRVYPYIQLACLAYREKKFDDCETLFSEARRRFPTAPEVPNFYAEILSDKGDFENALKEYDFARKLEDAQEGIHVGVAPLVGKAALLARQPSASNFAEATKLFELACEKDPRSEQAKIGLAQLKLQQEEVDEAIKLFEAAADLSRAFEEKLQATTFAEAAKIQKRIRADPVMSAKIQETLDAYRAQGMVV